MIGDGHKTFFFLWVPPLVRSHRVVSFSMSYSKNDTRQWTFIVDLMSELCMQKTNKQTKNCLLEKSSIKVKHILKFGRPLIKLLLGSMGVGMR